jgi:1-acyl-sn-glycerol-3-phosphate acyltransferase
LIPRPPPSIPRRHSTFLRALGRWALAALRWRIEGNLPDLPRFVIIVAPHSSNWDFFIALFADLALDLDARFLGKHTIFVGPVGPVLRWLGGIPVVRGNPQQLVDQLREEFGRRERMVLALAPEGTRRNVAEWKTGFWRIARGAGVAIVPVGLDYARRAVIVGAPYWPTERLDDDLRALRSHFATVTPRRPRR